MRAALAKVVGDFGQNLQYMPLRAGVRFPKHRFKNETRGLTNIVDYDTDDVRRCHRCISRADNNASACLSRLSVISPFTPA